MSKRDRLIARLCARPTPSNIKWDELKALLESLGYRLLNNDGSRRKFFHDERKLLIICHKPHPQPDVAKGCVEAVVEHLRSNGLIT